MVEFKMPTIQITMVLSIMLWKSMLTMCNLEKLSSRLSVISSNVFNSSTISQHRHKIVINPMDKPVMGSLLQIIRINEIKIHTDEIGGMDYG